MQKQKYSRRSQELGQKKEEVKQALFPYAKLEPAPIFFFLYIHHINVYKVKRAGEGGWTIPEKTQ